jgi:protein TonB
LALIVLIVPLAAEVRLPVPVPLARNFHIMATAPVPTAPIPHVAGRSPRVSTPASILTAPISAPSGITPEPPGEIIEGALPGPTVEGGAGLDVGVPVPIPDRVEPPPPKPSARPVPVKIGGAVRPPAKIVDVAPVYPVAALIARLEGVVEMEATIDERGRVEHLVVVHSTPLFDAAALAAVRQWRFTPTLLNGVPVPVLMKVTVNFRLR